VAIGAHVSYRDREGFGRRDLDVPADRLAADLVEQWETLVAEVTPVGGRVAYVKPHGALYNRMAADPSVATTVVDALAPHCRLLVGPPDAFLTRTAAAAGVELVVEGFCDRGYDAHGRLVPRDRDGAAIDDPAEVGERARSLAVDGRVRTSDGAWLALAVRTLCLHSDRVGADLRGRAVRAALDAAGIEVRAFAPVTP
jgi:UPF0271 protein